MNNKTLFLLFVLVFFTGVAQAGWIPVNTGINDRFNSLRIWSTNYGLIAGDKGIYYTSTGGTTAGSWVRLSLSASPADSLVYEQSQFYKVVTVANGALFCGWDSIQDRAVLFKLNLVNLSGTVVYLGPPGSKLNDLIFHSYGNKYYAVGNNGLVLRADTSFIFGVITTNFSNDLFAVNQSFGGTRVSMAGDQIFVEGTEDINGLSLTPHPLPGAMIRGISFASATSYAVGDGYWRVLSYGTSLQSLPNFDFGPLNANHIVSEGFHYFVGTDHGIFVSNTNENHNFLEYQPSSNGLAVNDIHFTAQNSQTGYACGDNGMFLYTTDEGGPLKPYCNFNSGGGCASPSGFSFTGEPGTGTNSKWLINGIQVATGNSFFHVFASPGTYTVSFIAWNSSALYDTCTRQVPVVATPQVNQPVTLSDSILCQKEPIQLTIQNTQLDYLYTLRKGLTGMYGSAPGNGGTLTWMTDSLTTGGNYFLRVSSTQAQCTADFTNQIYVGVEHTESRFHATAFNAEPGEPVTFHAISPDAQFFQWSFGPNAVPATSTGDIVSNVVFSGAGATSISLYSQSLNGCSDSITAPGPFLYNEPAAPDSNWAFNLDCNDPPWTGFYMDRVCQLIPDPTGFIVCGTAMEDSVKSRYGRSPDRTVGGGGYIARYTENGTFKWMITSYDSLYNFQNYNKSSILSVARDASGNLYAAGQSYPYVPFTDNFGDVHYLANAVQYYGRSGFVAKFDSAGKLIWAAQVPNYTPRKIKIDAGQNVIMIGFLNEPMNTLMFASNGSFDTLCSGTPTGTQSERAFILKIDSVGHLKWFSYIYSQFVNHDGIWDFTVDASQNIYVTGGVESWLKFYDAGNISQAADSTLSTNSNSGEESYIVKYDSTGHFQWRVFLYHSSGSSPPDDAFIFSIVADPAGNCYVTGRKDITGGPIDSLFIRDPFGTITRHTTGGFYLASFDPSGRIRWMEGCQAAQGTRGLALWLEGNEITAMVRGGMNGILTSADGNSQSVFVSGSDFLLASYDTSGNLCCLARTGDNTNLWLQSFSNTASVIKDRRGYYYIASDLRTTSPPNPGRFLNDTLYTNGSDGFVAKFGTQLPGIPVHADLIDRIPVFSLYPVPATSNLYVDLRDFGNSSPVELQIFDAMGRSVYRVQTTSGIFNLQARVVCKTDGLYLITAGNNSQRMSGKFILQSGE